MARRRRPRCTLTLLVIATLQLPVLAKPFNIDDPLFIRLAQNVSAQPGNAFGFDVNWYGTVSPMWMVTENPPAAGYFFALAGNAWAGAKSVCTSPACARRARRHFGNAPARVTFMRQAAVRGRAVLFTPTFLSRQTRHVRRADAGTLDLGHRLLGGRIGTKPVHEKLFAGALIGLAMLTKYFGVALIPLLAIHGAMQKRKLGGWIFGLLIPLAAAAARVNGSRIRSTATRFFPTPPVSSRTANWDFPNWPAD